MAEGTISAEPKVIRVRTLTAKGQESYLASLATYDTRLLKAKKKIHDSVSECLWDKTSVSLKSNLVKCITSYNEIYDDYLGYLKGVKTHESMQVVAYIEAANITFQGDLQNMVNLLDTEIEPVEQLKTNHVPDESIKTVPRPPKSKASSVRSHRSSSTRSQTSTASSVARKQRAEVEAARVKAKFVAQEAELLKKQAAHEAENRKEQAAHEAENLRKKADFQAKLKLLESEKEVGEAEARLRILEEYSSEEEVESDDDNSSGGLNEFKKDRTESYVNQLSANLPGCYSKLNVTAPEFTPLSHNDPPQNVYSDFSRFLMKRDLCLNRISFFDDNPEFYRVWKEGFNDVVRELRVSPVEEMDLLIKYLGPESKKWAISIRSSNTHNATLGLSRIWERLDDRFASPEIVEASIKKRLSDFPKLGNKDSKKLFDLCDIVSQIESLKESDQFKALFAYFDTSSGINPIVWKLPFSIQDKWSSKAMDYKILNHVPYPPFSFFAEFLRNVTKLRNDPSFFYENYKPSGSSTRSDSPPSKGKRSQVVTIKTEASVPNNTVSYSVPKSSVVNQPSSMSETSKPSNSVEFSNTSLGVSQSSGSPKPSTAKKFQMKTPRFCLYHNVDSHILNFCKEFRSMSLDSRKDFLQKKDICIRCCLRLSSSHTIDNCDRNIYCGLCKDSTHVAAMHCDNNSSEFTPSHALEQHGGETITLSSICTKVSDCSTSDVSFVQGIPTPAIEQHGGETVVMNSLCTKVCDDIPKSCSKTFLVKVFPNDRPDLSLLCYAILDDQSNCSLAKSKFFDVFNEQGPYVKYDLLSCAGTISTTGRKAGGFSIQPIHGSSAIKVRTFIECNNIPNLRKEIPTPAMAQKYTHLSDIAEEIPPIDPSAEILLIIGRDVPAAHYVYEQRIGSPDAPFALKTTLGWSLIGDLRNDEEIQTPIVVTKTSVVLGDDIFLSKPCSHQVCMEENGSSIHAKETSPPKYVNAVTCDKVTFCNHLIDRSSLLSVKYNDFVYSYGTIDQPLFSNNVTQIFYVCSIVDLVIENKYVGNPVTFLIASVLKNVNGIYHRWPSLDFKAHIYLSGYALFVFCFFMCL